MPKSQFLKFLGLSSVMLVVGLLRGPDIPMAVVAQETRTVPLSCKVHSFLVNSAYQLPFKYDSPEITGGNTINSGDSIVYLFEVINNTGKDRITINKVTTTQISGVNEPIDIIDTRPINGSCSTNSSDKSIVCNMSYSFAESAHYPIEYLFRVTDNPNNYPKTSSLFTIETDAGSTQCASILMIKNQEKPNKILWETPYAKLSADNFYIKINDKKFFGKDPLTIRSSPGTENTTLEVSWQENSVEMRLYMYFRKIENNMWEMYDLRSYNGRDQGDWIYYKESLGNTIQSIVGYPNYHYESIFVPSDGSSNAEIYCKSCSINAFMPIVLPISYQGYSLEALIGLPKNEIITVSTNPESSFGVNVLLRDREGNIVTDQSGFSYSWLPLEAGIVRLNASSLELGDEGCVYGINKPCPRMHVDIKGLSAGRTEISVTVKRLSDNRTIAKTSFPVIVKEFGSTTPIEKTELERLQQEVDKLSNEIKNQQTALSTIQQTVNKITDFLNKFFRSIFSK